MIYFAIVIYNKLLQNSTSLTAIINHVNDNSIIVVDNSDINDILVKNKEHFEKIKKINYISNNGNQGLSVAYNKVLDLIHSMDVRNADYVCWVDDDTYLETNFFKQLYANIDAGYDILVPKIISKKGFIYSPNERGKLRNNFVLNKNKTIRKNKFNAINSCLTIKVSIYKNFRYNEALFLDQVDQLFFDLLDKSNKKIKILDIKVTQEFSQMTYPLSMKYAIRFSIRTKDILKYGLISPKSNLFLSFFKILGLSIVFFLKSHQIIYLKIPFYALRKVKFYRKG